MRVKRKLLLFTLMAAIPLCNSLAQTDKLLDIVLKHASVKTVFSEIKKQMQINFMYSNEDVRTLPNKDYNMKNASVKQVLERVLSDSPLTFEVVNNTVIIKKKEGMQNVTGKVVDTTGMPLPGVSVTNMQTGKSVTTDSKGYFSFPSNGQNSIKLALSYLGMKKQEVTWKGHQLNIAMEEDVSQLSEVVITGYQVIDKKKLTSAISSVKAEDIWIPGAMNIDQMMQGRIPDMIMTTNSGEVGVVPKIRIRGTSTLVGNREPLWVVDGIIVQDPVPIAPEELNDPDYVNRIGNAIAGLNPRDIDRIDVLKDASATALYGSKAANGVIVITTKKGKKGRPIISYDFTGTYRQRPRYTDHDIHLMNSKERVQFSKDLVNQHHVYPSDVNLLGYEGLVANLYAGKMDYNQFSSEVARLESMNTDWFKLLTEDAFSHQHTVSISGGSDDIRYYSSVGYALDNDVIKGNYNKRYTVSLNVDANILNNLTANFSLNANVGNREYDQENSIDYAYTASRALPALNAEGQYEYYKKQYGYKQLFNYNILNELDNSYARQNNTGMMFTTNLRYKLNDWLSAQGIFSYSTSNTEIENYRGEQTWYAASLRKSEYGEPSPKGKDIENTMPYGGELGKSYNRNNSYTARLQLDINKYFGGNAQHNIVANLGYEVSSNKYKGYDRTDRGYYNDRGKQFTAIDLDDYPYYKTWMQNNLPTITDNLTNMISGYVSVSYSYLNYFTLNANTRIDGSNQFGSRSNEKLLPIWSVSGSYNISEHLKMDDKYISNLALRTSYGYQGNMLNGQSPEMIIKKLPLDTHYNEFASNVSVYPNPNLRWERTSSFNLGLDFGLFNNAVQVNAAYYYKHTKDAFMNKQISSVNGRKEYIINSGTVINSGYSIDATVSPVSTRDFRWTLSASYSKSYNKMNSLPGTEQYELSDFLDGTALTKGHPVGTFWSYKFIGLNPQNGGPVFDDMQDRQQELIGLSKYDTYTLVLTPSGEREPTMQGSINNSFRYKSFRLSFTLLYSLGSKIRLFGLYDDGLNFNPEMNVNYEMVKHWRNPGDERYTDIPNIINSSSPESLAYSQHWSTSKTEQGIQLIAENAWTMYDNSDHRVVNGNYLKCSNLSFSYDFPASQLSAFGISMLSATLSTTNLFNIKSKRLKGQTPIQSGFSETNLSERPTWSLSLSVSF